MFLFRKSETLCETVPYLKHSIACFTGADGGYCSRDFIGQRSLPTNSHDDDPKPAIELGADISKEFIDDSGKIKVYFGVT